MQTKQFIVIVRLLITRSSRRGRYRGSEAMVMSDGVNLFVWGIKAD